MIRCSQQSSRQSRFGFLAINIVIRSVSCVNNQRTGGNKTFCQENIYKFIHFFFHVWIHGKKKFVNVVFSFMCETEFYPLTIKTINCDPTRRLVVKISYTNTKERKEKWINNNFSCQNCFSSRFHTLKQTVCSFYKFFFFFR